VWVLLAAGAWWVLRARIERQRRDAEVWASHTDTL